MQPTLAFRPFPLLQHHHLQTIIASRMHLMREPPSVTRLVRLADGDYIASEVSTPPGWHAIDPTVVLVHGLCGCHQSPYMIRLARKLWRCGIRAVRMNLRGCGSGHGLARQPYHSGRSDDVLALLADLLEETPRSPMAAIGFSLGGNLVLKLAGELGEQAPAYLSHVIAVCPAADLTACSAKLSRPENRFYEQHFVTLLKAAVAARHAQFPDLPAVNLPEHLTLRQFDDLYVAPHCGFRDALDYYQRCSAVPLVPQIAIPCHILFAADDPFIDTTIFDVIPLPPQVQVWHTERGGHLGFLGRPWAPGGYRWLDTQLLSWIQEATGSPEHNGVR
jgi:predicted alpha/beta-fold hydrolase